MLFLNKDDNSANLKRTGEEIPATLLDFKDVFSKHKADLLLRKKGTDYAINLLPDFKLPFRPIYPLS